MLKKSLMLACALFASNAQASWPNSADRLSKKLVFAEYHPWVATPTVGTKKDTIIIDKPVVGTKQTEVRTPTVKKP